MTLDYQQVQAQISELGENAPQRALELDDKHQRARTRLQQTADQAADLRDRVRDAVAHDPSLRCAKPVVHADGSADRLDAAFPAPPSVDALVLAADGSQINLDRHAEVPFCLINLGAFRMRTLLPDLPDTMAKTSLYYAEALYNMDEDRLTLLRDLGERKLLAELSAGLDGRVVAFTDGPVELWGAKGRASEQAPGFADSLQEHLENLRRLHEQGVTTAGYVDKPGADLVVRLLEVSLATSQQLPEIRSFRPLRGVSDRELFRPLLSAGARSAVFEIQSQSARSYRGPLALHFFYLNVGAPDFPWLARVEIPAWVAGDREALNTLHSVLVEQCRILGARPYPYALHRAHETALVTMQERDQVNAMIIQELFRRGVEVGDRSHKQAAKDLPGRTRYQG